VSDVIRAAGIMFQAPDGAVLLLRKVEGGRWVFPGGRIEGGEDAEAAARREAKEETSFEVGKADLAPHTRRIHDDGDGSVDFTTFLCKASDRFPVELSEEHDAWRWVHPDELLSSPELPSVSPPEEDEMGVEISRS
jgi:8-oxo-dGTP diphosphatase